MGQRSRKRRREGEPLRPAAERVAAGGVLVVADHVGGVLVEGSSGGDRHQLHAAAHSQDGETDLGRRREEGDLPGVAVLAPVRRPVVRFLAVPSRVDVRPT